MRSWLWWHFRELLDPNANNGIALPPDRELLLDLTAPKWALSMGKIKVESRADIIERIGRSPDWASAYVLAAIETPKRGHVSRDGVLDVLGVAHDPFQLMNQGA